MKNGKILVAALLSLSVFMSCDPEEDKPQVAKELTVQDAKTSMSKMSSDAESDVVDLVQSRGVEALNDLFSILETSNPLGGRVAQDDKYWSARLKNLRGAIVPKNSRSIGRSQEDDSFDFEANWGVYNWNPTIEDFEKTEEEVQIIVLNFPESEDATVNNASLRITDYAEVKIEEIDGDYTDTYYAPTKLNADLSIDGTKEMDLVMTASYNEDGEPVEGDVSIFINPYSLVAKFNDTSAKESTGLATLKKGTIDVFATDFKATFDDSEKEELSKLEGFIKYYDFKIQGVIDAKGIEGVEDAGINQYIDLEVFEGSAKVGDVVFVVEEVDGYEEDVAYVEYADGSREKLEDLMQPVIDRLEDEFEGWDIG